MGMCAFRLAGPESTSVDSAACDMQRLSLDPTCRKLIPCKPRQGGCLRHPASFMQGTPAGRMGRFLLCKQPTMPIASQPAMMLNKERFSATRHPHPHPLQIYRANRDCLSRQGSRSTGPLGTRSQSRRPAVRFRHRRPVARNRF